MNTVTLPSGAAMPIFGLGTWHMGERQGQFKAEVSALRYGLDLGVTLLDTAEMYGQGGAEEVIAEAIQGRRDQVYIVSKVYPHNASRQGMVEACERSLRRLQTDRIDLYLLHWRGNVPLLETYETFTHLREQGKILDFGVSNFDLDDMQEAVQYDQGLTGTNQILYNLAQREGEWEVLPWCHERQIPVMAYCPIAQGDLCHDDTLQSIADRHEATPAQIALAWLLEQDNVVVIPKSSKPHHIRENYAALEISLSDDDLAELDEAFPPPAGPVNLGIV